MMQVINRGSDVERRHQNNKFITHRAEKLVRNSHHTRQEVGVAHDTHAKFDRRPD